MSDSAEVLGALAIHLGNDHVGELRLFKDDVTEFRFAPDYSARAPRPVLGQFFEDDLGAPHRSRQRLPPFFSNLLPEGPLRELVADRADVASEREFFLLAHLGADLPGDVRAVPAGALPKAPLDALVEEEAARPSPLKFSLAGVQLKLSMVREGRGLTLPTSGAGGDWIVKLPGTAYRGVPENEFATMTWARLAGIEVPPFELVAAADVKGIPSEWPSEGSAFAIQRFDRPEGGRRIHIEDFAQVRNQYAREKYRGSNYETLGKIIRRVAGESEFEEFVRRLAFIVVSANADAHLKNWSLIYPDRVTPRLAPAYDLVSTIEFIERDALALNLAKTKDFDAIGLGSFESFAVRVGAEPGTVIRIVRETVQRALDVWPQIRREAAVTQVLASRLEAHWQRVPLVREA